MSGIQNRTDKRVVLGGLLIILGGLLLLNTTNIFHFHFSNVIFSWPFVMLVIGIFILMNTAKKLLGGILTTLGTIFLLPRIFPQIDYDGGIAVAIIMIAFGILIIFKKRHSHCEHKGFGMESRVNKDKIDDVAIFGGGTRVVSSDNFQGGSVTAIFGGSEINLINCKLAEGDNVIDVLTVFGGTTLIVPKEWNVVLNVTSILGGFSNKSVRNPNLVIDQSRTLHIKGLAMFGGGEIKTYL
jgi:predicted membrane protein